MTSASSISWRGVECTVLLYRASVERLLPGYAFAKASDWLHGKERQRLRQNEGQEARLPDGLKLGSAGRPSSCGPGDGQGLAAGAALRDIIHIPEEIPNFSWGGCDLRIPHVAAKVPLDQISVSVPSPPNRKSTREP